MSRHPKPDSEHEKEELERMREFAYRAPSPDSEPPTMQEAEESSETEGATAAAAAPTEPDSANPPPRDMEEALRRDPSPDDLDYETGLETA